MADSKLETLVGAVVIAVAIGFTAYAAARTDSAQGGGYSLVASFVKADGITAGADVRISGVKVGTVRSIRLDPGSFQAKVELSIREGTGVPSDSAVKVSSDGLLGGAHISIEPGGSDYMLDPGEEIEFTQGSVNILDLVGKAIYSTAN